MKEGLGDSESRVCQGWLSNQPSCSKICVGSKPFLRNPSVIGVNCSRPGILQLTLWLDFPMQNRKFPNRPVSVPGKGKTSCWAKILQGQGPATPWGGPQHPTRVPTGDEPLRRHPEGVPSRLQHYVETRRLLHEAEKNSKGWRVREDQRPRR